MFAVFRSCLKGSQTRLARYRVEMGNWAPVTHVLLLVYIYIAFDRRRSSNSFPTIAYTSTSSFADETTIDALKGSQTRLARYRVEMAKGAR